MRLFHELVFDSFFEGATGFGGRESKFIWDPVIGGVDTLRLMVVADRVSGTGVVLNVGVFEQPEVGTGVEFIPVNSPIPNTPLISGQVNVLNATLSDPNVPFSYGAFLWVSLNGTSPIAHVRIWVTGRGRA
jgi:hypothetical protein